MSAPVHRRVALILAACLVGTTGLAHGHVAVSPAESPAGIVERYRLAVPGEKPVPTTRVEVQFPAALRVSAVQALAGWRTTTQQDRDGHLVGALWEGGQLPSGHFLELGIVAANPAVPADLTWKVIQTYQDGSEVHWVGPPGAEFPAAVTRVRRDRGHDAMPVALIALLFALLATAIGALAWGRSRR